MKVKNLVASAFFIAAGIVLPLFFHIVGMGPVFLPMHISVLAGGFLLGGFRGFWIGFLTPILSSLVTGMPPVYPPVAFIMMLELGTYGFLTGILGCKLKMNIFAALLLAMIGGRIVSGAASWVMLPLFGLPNLPVWAPVTVGLITGFPGILIQVVTVPALVVSVRYATAKGRGSSSQDPCCEERKDTR